GATPRRAVGTGAREGGGMATSGRYSIGLDIGGTFTDIVITDAEAGEIEAGKYLTTPRDPSEGALAGLRELLSRRGLALSRCARVVHATTLATNAIIERKGARTGLLTTRGFRDVVRIGRERRYEMYSLTYEFPTPLVPGPLRREVTERVDAEGNVLIPLDEEEARRAVRELVEKGAETLAVCFLHAFRNPAHEERVRELALREFPSLSVSISSEISREIREYERTSTTLANAYVKPLVGRYLRKMEENLDGVPLYLMASNGGITAAATAAAHPVRTLESGPAAGVIAASFFGGLAGEGNVLAFDMGGTTAKLCLVEEGEPHITYTFEVARVQRYRKGSGLPIQVPAIDLIELGAGGGSIARLDRMGLLKVGPESAGADPGPACYGLGGSEPTVTDADLLLGYLNPDYFLGGKMAIYPDRAREAFGRLLAGGLGGDLVRAAWGVHNIVNENMASAVRIHVTEKGKDPRRFTLVATGGAGPVHAFRLAEKVRIPRILCPPSAGVASAVGLLVVPFRTDSVDSYVVRLAEVDWERLDALYRRREGEARALLAGAGAGAGVDPEGVRFSRVVDMCYVGQGFQIPVPVPLGRLTLESARQVEEAFKREYTRFFGRTVGEVKLEVYNWRLFASAQAAAVRLAPTSGLAGDPLKGRRPIYLPEEDGMVEVAVYDRYRLRPGRSYEGPAVVEERESTAIVGPRARFSVEENGNLIIEREEAGG
ncbi:MAG: hydantoinase/oxoprolinase family protein, partial [Nitrospinota bacterium]